MTEYLSDDEIRRLIAEPKPLAADPRVKLKLRSKRGHDEWRFEVRGRDGGEFAVLFRRAVADHLAFSVILVVRPPGSLDWFRLRRYNGYGHRHTNRIERTHVDGPHIHQATERYQQLGPREDSYAEPTDRYTDMDGAFECLLEDCGFEYPGGRAATFEQPSLGLN